MVQAAATPRVLRVLMIEDSADDADLMLRELRRAGFDVQARRVETVAEVTGALDEGGWDVFISDYALPTFSGLDALRLVQERSLDVPFIIVSGAISDETAVAAMKNGAHDYVLKQNLARLAPAISRELREAHLRREQQRVQQELEALNQRSAAELRRSHDQLQVVLSGVAEGIVAEDAAGLIYVNNAAARMLGYTNTEEMTHAGRLDVRGRISARDESGDVLAAGDFPGARALSERRSVESVLTWRGPKGDERWYIVTSTPYFDDQRRVWTAITIFRDITERQQAEATARFLADASQTLATSIAFDATLTALARLVVPHFCDWSVVEIVDGSITDRLGLAVAHAEPRKEEIISALVQGSPEVWRSLAPHVRRTTVREDVSSAWLGEAHEVAPRSLLSVPLRVGGPDSVMVFARTRPDARFSPDDVTLAEEIARRGALALENALLYRQAQEAIAARDEFLSIASHELRTPLTTLTLQLQRIQQIARGGRAMPPPADAGGKLEQAVRQAHRLAGLIDTLLDVSRVSTGRLQLQRESMDLSEALRQLAERLTEDASRANCTLVVKVQERLTGEWDRQRLEQVVTNLLSNAFKYGAGHPVELTARGDADTVELAVRDHGIGIAPTDVSRVFRRFERAVSSRHYAGLGLGLFIVQQIVDAHAGTTHVESVPGKGSTFTVSLPRRSERATQTRESLDSAHP